MLSAYRNKRVLALGFTSRNTLQQGGDEGDDPISGPPGAVARNYCETLEIVL